MINSVHKALKRHFIKENPQLKNYIHESDKKPWIFSEEWDRHILNKVKRIYTNILTYLRKD